MSLPVFRRFTLSDIPSAPNWVSQITEPLNLFCEGTIQSLNKNLTIGENVQGAFFSTTFTTDTNYNTGTFRPISFAYNGGGQPQALLLAYIGRTNGAVITNATSINGWSLNINTKPYVITCNWIAGLAPSTQYKVTFLAL